MFSGLQCLGGNIRSPAPDAEIKTAFERLSAASVLGCDTETSGLSARYGKLYSIQFSDGDFSVLVPYSEGVEPGILSELLGDGHDRQDISQRKIRSRLPAGKRYRNAKRFRHNDRRKGADERSEPVCFARRNSLSLLRGRSGKIPPIQIHQSLGRRFGPKNWSNTRCRTSCTFPSS